MSEFRLLMTDQIAPPAVAGCPLSVRQLRQPEPEIVSALLELDLLSHSEPRLSRHVIGRLVATGRWYLLYVGDRICGSCCLLRSWREPGRAVLTDLTIRPGFHGQGADSFFLLRVLGLLAHEGLDELEAYLRGDDLAAKLLLRCGFAPVASDPTRLRLQLAERDAEQALNRAS